MQLTRLVVIGAVLAGSGVLFAAPAHAITYAAHAQFVGNTLTVTAKPGYANRIEITYQSAFTVSDTSGAIQLGSGCKYSDPQKPHIVTCSGQDNSVVNVYGGDLDDILGVRGTSLQTTTLYGGDGPDRLESDYGATLNGEGGDDWFNSKGFPDAMYGGGGFDTVNYNNSNHFGPVTADADGQPGDDGKVGEGDTIGADVEAIVGGFGSDYLIGNDLDNQLNGGPGDDVLDGGLGADVMIGGPDTDEAFYGSRAVGVTVMLDRSIASGEPGEGDMIGNDVENARGGSGDDQLTGSAVRNSLFGGPGRDQLFGLDGDDTLSGGPGFDGLDGGAGFEDVCSIGPDFASTVNCEIIVR